MKGKIPLILAGVSLVAAGIASSAQANSLINITTTSLPDLITTYGTPVNSQPLAEKSTPQGDTQIFGWLQTQVPSGDPAAVNNILATGSSTSVGNLSSYVGDYLVIHWGNGPANKFFDPKPNGGFDEAFYITGNDLANVDLTIPTFTGKYKQGHSVVGPTTLEVGGLSFWRVYGNQSVPDGGTTVLLLGGALSGLGLLRRKLT